uniref:Uncharacterized protein n=1 Tax=Euglena viridis TaxID=3040 RepID=M1EUQ9_EUGVI|nr:hypothetical protein I642_p064 [Euglena viridis]AEY70781.1 hypothetical protein [Euglena viridis]
MSIDKFDFKQVFHPEVQKKLLQKYSCFDIVYLFMAINPYYTLEEVFAMDYDKITMVYRLILESYLNSRNCPTNIFILKLMQKDKVSLSVVQNFFSLIVEIRRGKRTMEFFDSFYKF